MTIEIPATRRTVSNPKTNQAPATAFIGVDLTLLGAHSVPLFDGEPAPIELLDFSELACAVNAAHKGGIDFVTLDSSFAVTTEADHNPRLDAARAAAQLSRFSRAGVIAQVAGTAKEIYEATDILAEQTDGWGGLTITLRTDSDFDAVRKAAEHARRAGLKIAVVVTNPSVSAARARVIAQIADLVRLHVEDPHAAREARFAIRAAGKELGRNIPVVACLGIVISASVRAAQERALLVSGINNAPLFEGLANVVGTVNDVADEIEYWVSLGAADGVLLAPASLPTDLASVLRGVLPLIRSRCE